MLRRPLAIALVLAVAPLLAACSPNVRNIPQVADELSAQHDSDASLVDGLRGKGVRASALVDLDSTFVVTAHADATSLASAFKAVPMADVVVKGKDGAWTVSGTVEHVDATASAFDHVMDGLITTAANHNATVTDVGASAGVGDFG